MVVGDQHAELMDIFRRPGGSGYHVHSSSSTSGPRPLARADVETRAERLGAVSHGDEPEAAAARRFGIEADALVAHPEAEPLLNPLEDEMQPVRAAVPGGVRHGLGGQPNDGFLVARA